MRELNILICGVGGQGNVLLERVLGNSAMKEGYLVRGADTFGAAQRGGSVLSHIRIGSEVSSSLVPQGRCDIILGLEPGEALSTAVNFLRKDGLVIVNVCPILPAKVKVGDLTYPSIQTILGLLKKLTQNVIVLDATTLAKETTGSERAMNIVMIGTLMGVGVLPINSDTVIKVIERMTGGSNIQAFKAGFEIGKRRQGLIHAICGVNR